MREFLIATLRITTIGLVAASVIGCAVLGGTVYQHERAILGLIDDRDNMEAQAASLERDLTDTRSSLDDAREVITNANDRIVSLGADFNRAKVTLAEIQSDLGSAAGNGTVETLRTRVDSLDRDLAGMENALFGFRGTPTFDNDVIGGLENDYGSLLDELAGISRCLNYIASSRNSSGIGIAPRC